MRLVGSNKGIHSPEFHKKKVKERNLKRALGIFIALVVIAIPIYLARTSRFLIQKIVVSGNSVTKAEDIEAAAAVDLAGDYAFIFPRANAALYPKDSIAGDLLAKLPRLASADIELTDSHTLTIAVSEHAPAALYCLDVSDPSAPKECSFIDVTGYVFAPAPAFSGDVYLAYTDQSSSKAGGAVTNPIGRTILPAEEFKKTLEFAKEVGNLGIYPRVFEITADEYHLVLNNGTKILWNRKDDSDNVYSSLVAFLADASVRKDPQFLEKALYIDLRFDSKVYYKFRDGS